LLPELKFAVLGLVRAWRGEAELSLGSPQQRAVLAMLLLAEGREVTLSALIGGLWEGEPPLAAAGTVRTYVSRLRRGLSIGIAQCPPGGDLPTLLVHADLAMYEAKRAGGNCWRIYGPAAQAERAGTRHATAAQAPPAAGRQSAAT
jgi:DNA-binding SARP family transcriptional activator